MRTAARGSGVVFFKSQLVVKRGHKLLNHPAVQRLAYATEKNNKRKATTLATSQHIKSQVLYLVDVTMGMSVAKFYAMLKTTACATARTP